MQTYSDFKNGLLIGMATVLVAMLVWIFQGQVAKVEASQNEIKKNASDIVDLKLVIVELRDAVQQLKASNERHEELWDATLVGERTRGQANSGDRRPAQ